MDKKFLQDIIEKKIKKYGYTMTIGDLENLMESTFNEDKVHYDGVWLFQKSDDLNDECYFLNEDEAVDYFINNLDKYFKLYLEFEGDIEPSGYADVYMSYNLDKESKNIFIEILKDIKNKKTSILADFKEIIDTIPNMYYSQIVGNLRLENLKIIK